MAWECTVCALAQVFGTSISPSARSRLGRRASARSMAMGMQHQTEFEDALPQCHLAPHALLREQPGIPERRRAPPSHRRRNRRAQAVPRDD